MKHSFLVVFLENSISFCRLYMIPFLLDIHMQGKTMHIFFFPLHYVAIDKNPSRFLPNNVYQNHILLTIYAHNLILETICETIWTIWGRDHLGTRTIWGRTFFGSVLRISYDSPRNARNSL